MSSGAAGNRNPVLTESLARVLGQSNPSGPSFKYRRTLFAGHFGIPLRMRARFRVTSGDINLGHGYPEKDVDIASG